MEKKIGNIVRDSVGRIGLILKIKKNMHIVEDICHEWSSPNLLVVMFSCGKIETKFEPAYELVC